MSNKNENKVHVGMMLNTKDKTDNYLYSILSNLPSYETKSKYLRKALLFYQEHKNDPDTTENTGDLSANKEVIELKKNISNLSKTIAELLERVEALENAEIKEVKTDTKKVSKKGKPGSKQEEKEDIEQEEDKDIINLDSSTDKIQTHVDYNDFMSGFFGD